MLQDKVLYFEFHMLLHALDVGNSLIPEKNGMTLALLGMNLNYRLLHSYPNFDLII